VAPPDLIERAGTISIFVRRGTVVKVHAKESVRSVSKGSAQRGQRRGRPPAAERALRREDALSAALTVLAEQGYERMTMLDVAQRAGSSKESLYSWFESKEGMVVELIRRQASETNEAVAVGLASQRQPTDVLVAVADRLQALLFSATSLALNRAAMTSPSLAAVLLSEGRHRTGPLIESYLARLNREGALRIDDPPAAFKLFYGMVVQDTQIRVLLGEPPPSETQRRKRARTAVNHFFVLHATTRPT
jgi:AcrR family transcriptional regulator